MSIKLFDRVDRLGANITTYAAQIIYAIHQKFYIHYDKTKLKYAQSIFVQVLFDFIDLHNQTCNADYPLRVWTNPDDWITTTSRTTQTIQCDMISFFHKHIYPRISLNIYSIAVHKGYVVPFDPKKTLLIHLRLDDVYAVSDYDGSVCANYYRKQLEAGETCVCKCWENTYNRQAPLSNSKLERIIEKYPDLQVRLVMSPGSTTTLPYECIRSTDESYDLFLLCMCDIVVLSRSTYALSALLFGSYKEAYVPLWGHMACMGLYSKYDKTSNLTYFS